jgi:hypothetical protein
MPAACSTTVSALAAYDMAVAHAGFGTFAFSQVACSDPSEPTDHDMVTP